MIRYSYDMNSGPKRKVVCHDIYGKLYKVPADKLSFRPSVYGVIIRGSKILLSKQWDGYDFPGGGIKLDETVEEALMREVKEETGLRVRMGKIVACQSSFFKLPSSGNYVNAVLVYYLCAIAGGKISTDYFDAHEKEYAGKAEWLDISKVGTVKFYNSVDNCKVVEEAQRIKNCK